MMLYSQAIEIQYCSFASSYFGKKLKKSFVLSSKHL